MSEKRPKLWRRIWIAEGLLGLPGIRGDLKAWGEWAKKAWKVSITGFPVSVVVAQWNSVRGWIVDNPSDAVIYLTGAVCPRVASTASFKTAAEQGGN